MAFSDVNVTTKISFFGLCGTMLLFLISFGTDHWFESYYIHSGLWIDGVLVSWWRAVQAMECMALIAGLASIGLLGLFVFVDSFYRNAIVLLLSKVAPMGAGVLSMLGVIIYGWKLNGIYHDIELLGYSFWLCVVSSIGFFACGGIHLATRRPV